MLFRKVIQYFLGPFAVKAPKTSLIFVEGIEFHQINLLDVHKVYAIWTGHKLRFRHLFSIPLLHWNTADLVLYWPWNYLPEKASCYFWNNNNSQGSSYNGYLVCGSCKTFSRRIYICSPFTIWSCILFSKDCLLTITRLSRYFGTHLTIFAKSYYYFDVDKSAITLQPSKSEELFHFPILIEKYRVPQLPFLREISQQLKVFTFFPYQNLGPIALLVRVQYFRKCLYKAVTGPISRPIVFKMTLGHTSDVEGV